MQPVITGFLLVACIGCFPNTGLAQANKEFRARLSTVPIDVVMQATVAGSGSAPAVLSGRTLSIDGTFSNLKSPATVARIHIGPKGISGPSVFDLQVTPRTSGTIKGAFELTPAQIEALTKNRFYIQLHSEKAPEGNLWGWLLPQEARR